MTHVPQFSILTPPECMEVLLRNHVGRLAFVNHKTVDIEPLGYVADGSWIFMRSADGAKLEALAHNPYVAFEVDEVRGPLDWKSVVVHGTIYVSPKDGAPLERREYERAVRFLQAVMPGTLAEGDPVPERTIVYGLHIDRFEGRMAESRARSGAPLRAKVTVQRTPRRRVADGF